jgi:hypothetical protein
MPVEAHLARASHEEMELCFAMPSDVLEELPKTSASQGPGRYEESWCAKTSIRAEGVCRDPAYHSRVQGKDQPPLPPVSARR